MGETKTQFQLVRHSLLCRTSVYIPKGTDLGGERGGVFPGLLRQEKHWEKSMLWYYTEHHWLAPLLPQQLCSGHLLLLLASIPYSFLLKNYEEDEDEDDDLSLSTSQTRGDPAQNVSGCPAQCTCPTEETVDCGGLDLHIFPSNISTDIQHLSLQVMLPWYILGQIMSFALWGKIIVLRKLRCFSGVQRKETPWWYGCLATLVIQCWSSFCRITNCKSYPSMNYPVWSTYEPSISMTIWSPLMVSKYALVFPGVSGDPSF